MERDHRFDNGGECGICYETDDNEMNYSDCGHLFHVSCWNQWMDYSKSVKRSCPVCRADPVKLCLEYAVNMEGKSFYEEFIKFSNIDDVIFTLRKTDGQEIQTRGPFKNRDVVRGFDLEEDTSLIMTIPLASQEERDMFNEVGVEFWIKSISEDGIGRIEVILCTVLDLD